MNGVEINFHAEGLSAHCPCRGCAACGVFWDGVRAACHHRVRRCRRGDFGEGVSEPQLPGGPADDHSAGSVVLNLVPPAQWTTLDSLGSVTITPDKDIRYAIVTSTGYVDAGGTASATGTVVVSRRHLRRYSLDAAGVTSGPLTSTMISIWSSRSRRTMECYRR